jgi:hypothetical protein
VGRLDEEGGAMTRRLAVFLAVLFLMPLVAQAHLGSPDVFFEGKIGAYLTRVTIRMPTVVPGRAEISVNVEAAEAVTVSFLPLYSRTAISNAPPPDVGVPIRGETNYYAGDLWLMTSGAYGIQVNIHGSQGDGSVEIPVTSVALSQLPLPRWLGGMLVVLIGLLVLGGAAIVAGAARDGELAAGVSAGKRNRRKGLIAGTVTLAILVFLLVGGMRWWASEERAFRERMRGGAWPDMRLTTRTEASQQILELTLGEHDLRPDDPLSLIPDHGKLLHLFLIRDGEATAIAHLHPVRKEGKTFQVVLPPLPEGRYRVFCDMTLASSSMSFTATNSVQIPVPVKSMGTNSLEPDPDDSWANYAAAAVPLAEATNAVFTFADGRRVVWKRQLPLQTKQEAGLRFEVSDAAGNAVSLEPYMGMMSHAAVMRRDGTVFAHLHPSGNYSMAAQGYFMDKVAQESGAGVQMASMAGMPGMNGMPDMPGMDHAQMAQMHHAMGGSVISLPYEFPSAGDYRIWVQFKTGGEVRTAVFDAEVQ